MKEPRYFLNKEQIDEIARVAAEKAVEAYRLYEEKVLKQKENDYIRITKNKLKAFRRVKASLSVTETFSNEEKIELRWAFVRDLMGSAMDSVERAEDRIRSIENKRKKDSFEIWIIEKAMELYKKEVDTSGTEEEKRRYRELYAMYISDDPKDVSLIATKENVSEKIVYRDLGIAIKILSVYLLGM